MSQQFMPLSSLLNNLAPPPGSKPGLAKEHADFLEQNNALQKLRANVSRFRKDFEHVIDNPEALQAEGSSGSVGFDAHALADMELQVLSEELKIRVALPPYISRWSAAMRDALTAADKAVADFEKWLTEKLLGIGYLDPVKNPQSQYRIINDFHFRHPKRHGLWIASRAAHDAIGRVRPKADNEVAITSIRQRLRESGRRLAGHAGAGAVR